MLHCVITFVVDSAGDFVSDDSRGSGQHSYVNGDSGGGFFISKPCHVTSHQVFISM